MVGEVNNIDYMVTMAPVKGWCVLAAASEVLHTRKIDNKEEIVVTGSKNLKNGRSCGVSLVYCGEYLPKVVKRKNNSEPAIWSWVPKTC